MSTRENYMLAIESTYTQQPSGQPAPVRWYTCLRCGAAVIELGPNTEGRMVHDLWHLAFGVDLLVPERATNDATT